MVIGRLAFAINYVAISFAAGKSGLSQTKAAVLFGQVWSNRRKTDNFTIHWLPSRNDAALAPRYYLSLLPKGGVSRFPPLGFVGCVSSQ